MYVIVVKQATGTRLGALTQIVAGLLAGIIIAFVYGWLVTLLILLIVPVLLVAMTLHTKLVLGTGGTGKKAYEKAGSVSCLGIYYVTVSMMLNYLCAYLNFVSDCL